MPDKKPTDSEIVKALEYCIEATSCIDCNVNQECDGRTVLRYALDLINRLQAENEKWQGGYMTQKQEITNLEIELKAMRGAANSYKAENKRLSTLAELGNTRANDYRVMRDRALKAEAENERLKNAYKQCAWERDAYIEIENTSITEAKAEAYKEFAERLNELINFRACIGESHYELSVTMREVDNLLKESVGDK